jgi:hypothetical protein
MADQTLPADRPAGSVCPWCSTAVTPETVTCPSCGAILLSGEEPDLPGVTAIDQSVIRGEKKPVIRSRSRLLSWISGEYPEDTSTAGSPEALAPPDPQVQREILRLELEAEVANLQAESDALLSEAVAEGRELPEGIQPFATSGVVGVAGAVIAEAVASDETGAETPAALNEPAPAEAAASVEGAPPAEAMSPPDAAPPADTPRTGDDPTSTQATPPA